jgi:anhydro-N-acetylmuramic acid kinase
MVYRAIGIMSGSSLDGLDIAFVEFHEQGGKWRYELNAAACYPYNEKWKTALQTATTLSALEYELLHAAYGEYIGSQVNRFIDEKNLHYKVALISSHGHTSFHLPSKKMTAQLGHGAAIAAATKLPVVSDLRAMDVSLGGQGAPIVPIGERFLLGDHQLFLNLGGIANISCNRENYIAFDVCAANRVLNMLANEAGKEYDENGEKAAAGNVNADLLNQLNALDYYKQPYPKSLANDFGTDVIFPMIRKMGLRIDDALRTYVEHIVMQISNAVDLLKTRNASMLVTGGGAFNGFLIERLKEKLENYGLNVVIPDEILIAYKEAMIMAFIGVLRWRQEYNVLASVTGAERNSIGGAIWNGQEA